MRASAPRSIERMTRCFSEVRRERDVFHLLAPAIEEHEVVLAAEDRRGLVEQSAIHADEFIFRAAAEFREVHRGHLERVKLGQQQGGGHLERGRTREPRTGRKGGLEPRRESTGRRPGAGEHFRNAQRVVGPLTGAPQPGGAIKNPGLLNPLAGKLHSPAGQCFPGGCDAELE
jgi:hypothetical protein